MAKELPFFKFEPGLWDNGRIQMCSFEAQGVFINLCSMYWHRLGDVPYKLALQKICKGNAVALQSLCDEGVVKLIDGMICIDFLNEQLSEFENTSKTNSEAARIRWEKHRKNAVALQPKSERNAIRGEKIREDESYSAPEVFETKQQAHKEITGNYHDIEKARSILSNRGWVAATDNDVGALLFHFLETNDDATEKPKAEVRQHFKNWINKYDLNELTKLSISISTRFRQRQQA